MQLPLIAARPAPTDVSLPAQQVWAGPGGALAFQTVFGDGIGTPPDGNRDDVAVFDEGQTPAGKGAVEIRAATRGAAAGGAGRPADADHGAYPAGRALRAHADMEQAVVGARAALVTEPQTGAGIAAAHKDAGAGRSGHAGGGSVGGGRAPKEPSRSGAAMEPVERETSDASPVLLGMEIPLPARAPAHPAGPVREALPVVPGFAARRVDGAVNNLRAHGAGPVAFQLFSQGAQPEVNDQQQQQQQQQQVGRGERPNLCGDGETDRNRAGRSVPILSEAVSRQTIANPPSPFRVGGGTPKPAIDAMTTPELAPHPHEPTRSESLSGRGIRQAAALPLSVQGGDGAQSTSFERVALSAAGEATDSSDHEGARGAVPGAPLSEAVRRPSDRALPPAPDLLRGGDLTGATFDKSPEPEESVVLRELVPGEARAASPVPLPQTQVVSGQPELARGVAVQIAEVVNRANERAIELKLHPEELGRVSLTLSGDGQALSVAVSVDRAETLELMRRHIDMLGEELRKLGYGSVAFDFGDGRGTAGQNGSGGAAEMAINQGEQAPGAEEAVPAGPPPPQRGTSSNAIDIRM
jgi:Flagellar hook-length control protein FliK